MAYTITSPLALQIIFSLMGFNGVNVRQNERYVPNHRFCSFNECVRSRGAKMKKLITVLSDK